MFPSTPSLVVVGAQPVSFEERDTVSQVSRRSGLHWLGLRHFCGVFMHSGDWFAFWVEWLEVRRLLTHFGPDVTFDDRGQVAAATQFLPKPYLAAKS
jgi:extradiol dioxygenase family protein